MSKRAAADRPRQMADEFVRGVVVLWPGRGLYVVLDAWQDGCLSLFIAGLEGQPDILSAPAWRVRPISRPAKDHAIRAHARLTQR